MKVIRVFGYCWWAVLDRFSPNPLLQPVAGEALFTF